MAESVAKLPRLRSRDDLEEEDRQAKRVQVDPEEPSVMTIDFHAAIKKQQLDTVKCYIALGVPVNEVNPQNKETPLSLICKLKPTARTSQSIYVDIIKVLIEAGASVDMKNGRGLTPLHVARSTEAVNVLLQNGACINVFNDLLETPLFLACKSDRYEVAAALIEQNASTITSDKRGRTPLHVASYSAMQLLLLNDPSVDTVDREIESPLFEFCRKSPSPVEKIDLLLHNGMCIDFKNKYGRTPLHIASGSAVIETVDLLLGRGAEVNVFDINGDSPLFLAAKKRASTDDVISSLLNYGASVNVRNKVGKTPLHECYYSADILLRHGAEANQVDDKGESPVFAACRGRPRRDNFFACLIEHGASLNIQNCRGETPLYVACSNLRVDIAPLLLQSGASVNIANSEGESPLFAACRRRDCPEELITKLIEFGADVAMKNFEGQTPLHASCSSGALPNAMILLQKGASSNEVDNELETPWFVAHRKMARCTDFFTALLNHGASVNVQNKYGDTPLHIACERLPSVEFVTFLLENGASVNRKNKKSQTPLHKACKNRKCTGEVQALLQAGALVNEPDDDGQLPLEVALQKHCSVLLDYGARHCMMYSPDCCEFYCNLSRKHAIIVEHVHKMQVAGLVPCMVADGSDLELLEIYSLKGKLIGQSNVSLYNLLHMNVPRSGYDEILSTITPEHLQMYAPIYGNMLYRNCMQIKRIRLIDSCNILFDLTADLPRLPPEIAMKIFIYLTYADLVAVLRAMNGDEPSYQI